MKLHDVKFPGESDEYRKLRNEILEDEIELRQHMERVAAKRRKLPLGGEVPKDYEFETESGKLRISEMFRDGKDTLVLYSFMYGPQMDEPCPFWTSILDGLEGQAKHIRQRANFYVCARSPIERVAKFAKSRGWRDLSLVSSANNSYNVDYHGEDDHGDQLPAINVFVRRDGRIHHFYYTELIFTKPDAKGQDPRPLDIVWPLWNVLDMTPEGRGEDWLPSVSYS